MTKIPLKAQPIKPNYSGSMQLWTRKPRIMVWSRLPSIPIQVLERQLDPEEEYDRLDLVSDAAVHVAERKSAVSWQIIAPDGRKDRLALPLQMKDVSNSYREELFGLYHCLSMTLQEYKRVKAISCHCDWEAAILKIRDIPINPGQYVAADMDIVLAIQQLIQDSDPTVSLNHVPGHPERRKRKEDFTFIELANWECDRDAEQYTTFQGAPLKYTPLPGAKFVIRIGRDEWLSGRPDWVIQTAFAQKELQAYISKRLTISLDVVKCIDTTTIGTVRATQEWGKFVRTSKLLFSWLPVGHNWHHYSDMDSDRCPCCGDSDETFLHVLQCTDRRMIELRTELFDDMWRAMQDSNLPAIVTSAVLEIFRSVCNSEQVNRPTSTVIADAWDIQQSIGFHNMAIGWTRAFKTMGSKDPEGCTCQLLTHGRVYASLYGILGMRFFITNRTLRR